jgi:effector-binding domain-containing protein
VAGPVPASDLVRGGELPAGRYLTLVHTGPYDGLIAANAAVQDFAAGNGITLESSADGRRFAGRVEHYRTEVAYLIQP